MARVTKAWYLWRRHPSTNLTYICLAVLVIVVVVKVSSNGDDVASRNKDERAVDEKSTQFQIDPSMPLDRVADDSLAEWISLLVKRKQDDIEAARDSSISIKATLKNVVDFVEILGESRDPLIEENRNIILGESRDPLLEEIRDPNSKHLQLVKQQVEQKVSDREESSRKLSDFLRKNFLGGADRRAGPPLPKASQELFGKPEKENLVHRLKSSRSKKKKSNTHLDRVPSDRKKTQSDRDAKVNAPFKSSTNSKITKTDKVNVLIIAAMRTGSSFLGELFQQRSDFFYMFEPGMMIMHKLDSLNLTRRVIYTKLIQMLDNFYSCQFNDISFFIDLLNEKTLHARKQAVPALVTSQFCRENREPHLRPKDKCDPVSERALEIACKTRANTAIKSIRILDVNLMLSAIQSPDINLKLIHLVRDPRSMVLSRLRLAMPSIDVFNVTELTDTYRNILIRYCSNWLQNYEIGHYVPFVRKNYLLVRYEDLALEPYTWARKIYEYAGLGATIPAEIQTWLDENTNDNDPSKKKSAAFSTKRDSKAVLVSWKRRLTLEMAQAIEEVGDCTRLMHATGYRLIGSDPLMLENQDHLVGPLPIPQLNVTAFNFM